jgi:hypothetical protein
MVIACGPLVSWGLAVNLAVSRVTLRPQPGYGLIGRHGLQWEHIGDHHDHGHAAQSPL